MDAGRLLEVAMREKAIFVPNSYYGDPLRTLRPDGRFLVASRNVAETGGDLLLLDLEAAPGAESVKPFDASSGDRFGAVISANGEWVAYYSNVSGRHEILIEKFPERGQKTSAWTGSHDPAVWSPDGRELYFTAPSTQGSRERDRMAVGVELTPTLGVSSATGVGVEGDLDLRYARGGGTLSTYLYQTHGIPPPPALFGLISIAP
jgi:hypothetical protein